jgi:hypothetical protein
MKKLVLMAVAIVAVSFASCGNKAANAEQATADSIRIADSIAAVEAAAAEAAASVADTTATDSAAVVDSGPGVCDIPRVGITVP